MHIEGRRWFQRSAGNTYHSVRIFDNGECLYQSGIHYGYGEQFLQTAWAWLAQNGHPELAERHENGAPKHYGTQYLREVLHSTYSVTDVATRKEL